MKIPNSQRSIWLHITGIFIFMTLPVLFSPDLFERISLFEIPPFQREFITYLLLLCFFYLSYLVWIPKLFYKKKYLLFSLCIFAAIVIIIWIPNTLVVDIQPKPHMMPDMASQEPPPPKSPFAHYGHYIVAALALLLLAFILKLDNISKQLKQDKLNAELAYLKAQINPHFLFNTLNSIYALAIQQSDATAEAVVKLSGMMRYVLNEAHHNTVSLEKEVAYINDYISLQSLRLPQSAQLNCVIEKPEGHLSIAPLLLIPFIENAFSFGVNPEKTSSIDIRLSSTSKTVSLFVSNDIVNPRAQNNGLGMHNTQTRLQMLYPGSHILQIEQTEQRFTVSLSIALL